MSIKGEKCPICEDGELHYSVCDSCCSEQADPTQVHANKLMKENDRLRAENQRLQQQIDALEEREYDRDIYESECSKLGG